MLGVWYKTTPRKIKSDEKYISQNPTKIKKKKVFLSVILLQIIRLSTSQYYVIEVICNHVTYHKLSPDTIQSYLDLRSLVLLEDALKEKGAACLDGSPPGQVLVIIQPDV